MVPALAVTASAEYELARECGFDQWVAAGVPAALDLYVVRALRTGRDVPLAVAAIIATNAASHLLSAGMLAPSVSLVVAVSAIAPLVMWRVHQIGRPAQVVPTEPEVEPEPDPVVICGGGEVYALAVPPLIEAEPVRLSPDEARAEIERGWREGLSTRETAERATRSPSYVGRIYQELEERHGPRPVDGQLALVGGGQ